MQYCFIKYSSFLFFLFTIPIAGWILGQLLPAKILRYAFFLSAILLLPVAIGYHYSYEVTDIILLYLFFTLGYAWFVSTPGYKTLISFLLAAILFVIGGYYGFIYSMGGSITVEKEWEYDNYQITYVKDAGFSGRPSLKYHLSKYAIIPLFVKPVEETTVTDSVQTCRVCFPETRLYFNACSTGSSYFKK